MIKIGFSRIKNAKTQEMLKKRGGIQKKTNKNVWHVKNSSIFAM